MDEFLVGNSPTKHRSNADRFILILFAKSHFFLYNHSRVYFYSEIPDKTMNKELSQITICL